MLLIEQRHCGRIPEDIPRESDDWYLLIYTPGGHKFLGKFKNSGDSEFGIWENEGVERKVVVGDCWVQIHDNPPDCLTPSNDAKE